MQQLKEKEKELRIFYSRIVSVSICTGNMKTETKSSPQME